LLPLLAFTGPAERAGFGKVERLPEIKSKYVAPRNVDVWLPDGYAPGKKKYPVLYMHDGQNVFDPKTSYKGVAWEVDSVLTALRRQKQVPDCIVVGIWNTPKRVVEYTPAAPFAKLPAPFRAGYEQALQSAPVSDAYLKYIVEEVKPYIDQHYATRPDREHTFIMGSSMGGLISLYAALEYPRVFGGAGCVSTHWTMNPAENAPPDFTNAMISYLDAKLPAKNKPRLYFDYGTTTLDARYEPHQLRIDSVLRAHGYGPKQWTTRKYEGAAHDEASWQKRVAVPLQFLLSAK
jgi:predicted alpha/beta superfamily hydrolase